jgi:hypothetical protein
MDEKRLHHAEQPVEESVAELARVQKNLNSGAFSYIERIAWRA